MRTALALLFFVAIMGFSPAPDGDNSLARVQKSNGLYLFTDSEPVAEYEYLGTVDIKRIGAFKTPQYTIIRDALIKELVKEFPEANGVIFHFVAGSADKADAIKFKN